jgi:membrane protein DedA with SNARE-associated domain/rhodanese-related sulfurtransferase
MQVLHHLFEQYGLWLVFANVLALQLGLPLPAWPTLVVVGALAAQGVGGIAPWQVVSVAVTASLVADTAWYLAGQRFGRRVLRLMCRVSLSPDSCVRQTERTFERWGAPSLMVAKFIPGFAAVATSMAGVMRTGAPRFLCFDAIGAALWSGVPVALGALLRGAVNEAIAVLEATGRWGLLALASALALYIGVKALQRQRLIRTLRMARVSPDELNAMLQSGQRPLIVDVRSPQSQREGRIPGAVWIDPQAFDHSLRASALTESDAAEVIVYCACPNEASAAGVARQLMKAGFTRVRPLAGGIEAWREKGFAVEPPAADAPTG